MREIKFRAWDTKEKKMDVPEHLAVSIGLDGVICVEMDDDGGKSGLWEHEIPEYRTRFELMQYTGLHDKNGKEIYEGDIIGYEWAYRDEKRGTVVVEYEESFAGYHPFCEPWDYDEKSFEDVMKTWEVIGNIYENKI